MKNATNDAKGKREQLEEKKRYQQSLKQSLKSGRDEDKRALESEKRRLRILEERINNKVQKEKELASKISNLNRQVSELRRVSREAEVKADRLQAEKESLINNASSEQEQGIIARLNVNIAEKSKEYNKLRMEAKNTREKADKLEEEAKAVLSEKISNCLISDSKEKFEVKVNIGRLEQRIMKSEDDIKDLEGKIRETEDEIVRLDERLGSNLSERATFGSRSTYSNSGSWVSSFSSRRSSAFSDGVSTPSSSFDRVTPSPSTLTTLSSRRTSYNNESAVGSSVAPVGSSPAFRRYSIDPNDRFSDITSFSSSSFANLANLDNPGSPFSRHSSSSGNASWESRSSNERRLYKRFLILLLVV